MLHTSSDSDISLLKYLFTWLHPPGLSYSMRDLSFLTRDRTQTPCNWKLGVFVTGLPGKSLRYFYFPVYGWQNWGSSRCCGYPNSYSYNGEGPGDESRLFTLGAVFIHVSQILSVSSSPLGSLCFLSAHPQELGEAGPFSCVALHFRWKLSLGLIFYF